MAEISLSIQHYNALNDIKKALNKVCDMFYEVRVFGSCVRSAATATSDIDILIVTKEKLCDRVKRDKLRELISTAAEQYGIDTDVVFYSLSSYQNDNSEFTVRLRKESKGLLRGSCDGL